MFYLFSQGGSVFDQLFTQMKLKTNLNKNIFTGQGKPMSMWEVRYIFTEVMNTPIQSLLIGVNTHAFVWNSQQCEVEHIMYTQAHKESSSGVDIEFMRPGEDSHYQSSHTFTRVKGPQMQPVTKTIARRHWLLFIFCLLTAHCLHDSFTPTGSSFI